MTLFVLFVFGSITLGAGAMLSPAWPTSQPRMALAGALSLALIVGGAIFYASLFGWNTLIIDYMLFALLVGIFLGGTLSHAQARAEAKGETLTDALQGWPGPQDLLFFVIAGVWLAWPAFILALPLGGHAPADALLTVTTRLGGTFNTLTPLYPQVQVAQPPGFYALAAYLSKQLGQSVALIHLVLGAVLAFLCVWMAYDLGAELRDKRLGRAMAVMMLVGTGLYLALLDSQYAALLGLLFGMAFLLYAFRYQRHGHLADLVAGGLLLGAVALAEPSTSLAFFAGFAIWVVLVGVERPFHLRRWLGLALGFPLVALAGLAPWLWRGGQPVDLARAVVGIGEWITPHAVVLPFALIGIASAFRRRWRELANIARFATVWLVVAGVLQLLQVAHVGWVWLCAPLSLLGGIGLLDVYETYIPQAARRRAYRHYYLLAGALLLVLLVFVVFKVPVLERALNLPPAPLSADDMAVLEWVRQNVSQDVYILGPDDAYWAPALAERAFATLPPATYWEVAGDLNQEDAIARLLFVATGREASAPTGELLYQQGQARLYLLEAGSD